MKKLILCALIIVIGVLLQEHIYAQTSKKETKEKTNHAKSLKEKLGAARATVTNDREGFEALVNAELGDLMQRGYAEVAPGQGLTTVTGQIELIQRYKYVTYTTIEGTPKAPRVVTHTDTVPDGFRVLTTVFDRQGKQVGIFEVGTPKLDARTAVVIAGGIFGTGRKLVDKNSRDQ